MIAFEDSDFDDDFLDPDTDSKSLNAKRHIQNNIAGNYLYLSVDIAKNKSDLIKKFAEIITLIQLIAPEIKEPKIKGITINIQTEIKDLPKNRKRITPDKKYKETVSLWTVYDMVTVNKKNYTDIARKLLKENGITQESFKIKIYYKDRVEDTANQISGAFKKAKELIKQVGEEAKAREEHFSTQHNFFDPITSDQLPNFQLPNFSFK